MAENIIHYPEANPIQMVRENDPTLFNGYNFRHYNEWWFTERLKTWEGTRKHYYQKLQSTLDRITVMIHANDDNSGVEMDIVTQCGTLVTTLAPNGGGLVPDFEISNQDYTASYPANTYSWDYAIAPLGLTDGVYYLILRVPFNGELVYMYSEPILIREQHPNTIQLTYYNTTNKFDIFFQHLQSFCLRVESHIYNLNPQSEDVSYEDERVDITLIDSVPYNTYTFGVRKVPEWMLNKVNRALSMNRVMYDGKYFTKDKDAKWEYSPNPNNAFKHMSIAIRPAKNDYSQIVQQNSPLLVWQMIANLDNGIANTRFPYFVHSARMTRSGMDDVVLMEEVNGTNTIIWYSTDCMEVRDEADELILLNHANNVTRVTYGQLGYYTYVYDDHDIQMLYIPHSSETNYTANNYMVLSRHFDVTFSSSWGSGQFYDIMGSYIGYGFVRQNSTHFSGAYGDGNPGVTYMVGGSSINLIGNIARIYHYDQKNSANTVTRFRAVYKAQTPNILTVGTTSSSRMPPGLQNFKVNTGGSGAYANLTWGVFNECKTTIFNIDLFDNAITATSGIAAFVGQQLPQLFNIDLSSNKLPAAGATGIDTFFVDMYSGGSGNEVYVATGVVTTKFQSPSAPPTVTSLPARTAILSDGWTIATD